MSIERIERQGWLSRLGQSFAGILIGCLFVGGALFLQFWNEGRTVRQQRLLESGRAAVVSIQADRLDPAHQGKLVHVVGASRADGLREDPVFKQIAEGIALRRRVEMFQWKERSERREETKLGGAKETRTTYHYDQVWDDEPIDSSRFEERTGHENPGTFPFENATWRADQVRLGAFELAPAVVAEIEGWKPLAPDSSTLPENLAASFSVDGAALSTVNGAPKVGDLRVRFERIADGPLSLVAEQRDGRLQAQAIDDDELLLVERGEHTAAQLFDAAERRNAGVGWLLRFVGFVVVWVGLGMVFAPLGVLADVIPFFGRATRWVTGLVSGVIAAALSALAIVSGWLMYRPWLLLLVLLGLVALIVAFWRRRPQTLAVPPSPPPPPPRS